MNIETTVSLYLLVSANALLAAAVLLAISRNHRTTLKERAFWSSPTGAALLSRSDRDELLAAIERRIAASMDNAGGHPSNANTDVGKRPGMPFDNAVRMARHGASLDDLARTCGLSVTEARLLKRVHGSGQESVAEQRPGS